MEKASISPEKLRGIAESARATEQKRIERESRRISAKRNREAREYAAEHTPRIIKALAREAEEAATEGEFSASYRERCGIKDTHKYRQAFLDACKQLEEDGFVTEYRIVSDSRTRYDDEPTPATYNEHTLEISWPADEPAS